jgi:hypothetical protein
MRNLDHLVLVGAENTDSRWARKGDLQLAFSQNVLMVPLSVITVVANDERLTCDGFSLGETVRLGNFEFIVNYFSGLSLSPRRGDAGAAFMGSTHSGASNPWRPMIEDSAEEFLTTSSREGSFVPPSPAPSPRRHDMRDLPAPVATTPWLKDILNIVTTQQAENSLQCRAEAFISSPWDISSNQLSHIPNSIFFRVNTHVSLIFFLSTFMPYISSIPHLAR